MENFIVSARKYRPATFDTVVGQASITNTLKNAIKNNHLAQAFLFCGPRGVGKTTCARILAKTINCFKVTAAIEACDVCESCKSFNEGHSLNVYELDAASNNSVDDIRNLVDQVRFAPQLGKYKVFIIDEVHMLSQAAFNAFLKTLEEPPRHAIFILATTEKHKIIPTILSRCQIFDFNRIQILDIAKHLAFIAKKENIAAEPDALHIISQKADGALRDALSIFDQIVSFAGNSITYKAVIENLNVLDYDYYFKVTDALLKEDISQSLLIYNEILTHGFDGHNFIAGLGEHFRNLMVCKDAVTLQLLEVGDNIKEKYKDQAVRSSLPFLLRGLNIISRCDSAYKSAKNPRLQVELALMQLASANNAEAEKKNDIIVVKAKGSNGISAKTEAPVENNVSVNPPVAPSKINTPEALKAPEQVKPAPTANPLSQQSNGPKPVVRLTQSISLKGAGKQNAEVKKEEKPDPAELLNQPKENFTAQALEKAWDSYIKILQGQGKMSLASTLGSRKPVLKENYLLEFTIDNKVQEQSIELEKTELMTYLRKELNNYNMQLQTLIDKTNSDTRPYTATDKFKRMAEKNPDINRLRQEFDLEIDI